MNSEFRKLLWKQFGASIDMLENAIIMCPDKLWDADYKFWYWAYHTIFYLDYYLSLNPQNFEAPFPFKLSELDPKGVLPERVYTKKELLDYLEFGRKKCHGLIHDLNEENRTQRFVNHIKDFSVLEVLLYNLRHVQHHAAQLNLILRQEIDDAPKWVLQTEKEYLNE